MFDSKHLGNEQVPTTQDLIKLPKQVSEALLTGQSTDNVENTQTEPVVDNSAIKNAGSSVLSELGLAGRGFLG